MKDSEEIVEEGSTGRIDLDLIVLFQVHFPDSKHQKIEIKQ